MPEPLAAPLEKDLNIKKNEKVNEDNFVFDLVKEDHEKFIDAIEQGEDFSKFQKEIDLEDQEWIAKRMDVPKFMQKALWGSTVPTYLHYYNENIKDPKNKLNID